MRDIGTTCGSTNVAVTLAALAIARLRAGAAIVREAIGTAAVVADDVAVVAPLAAFGFAVAAGICWLASIGIHIIADHAGAVCILVARQAQAARCAERTAAVDSALVAIEHTVFTRSRRHRTTVLRVASQPGLTIGSDQTFVAYLTLVCARATAVDIGFVAVLDSVQAPINRRLADARRAHTHHRSTHGAVGCQGVKACRRFTDAGCVDAAITGCAARAFAVDRTVTAGHASAL